MFKLGRKQLLGLLTAATVVVSTVGTFAVWDQLTATKTTKEVTLSAKTVTADASDVNLTAVSSYAEGAAPTYTSDNVVFNVDSADTANEKLTLSAKVKVKGTTDAQATDKTNLFNVKIEEVNTDGTTAEIANGTASGDDSSIAAKNTYKVSVTPKNQENVSDINVLKDSTMQVELSGQLAKK